MKKFVMGFIAGLLLLAATSAFGEEGTTVQGNIVSTQSVKYPQVLVDRPGVAFAVYSDENSGIIIPTYEGKINKIIFMDNGHESVIYNSPVSGLVISGHNKTVISGSEIALAPTDGGKIILPSWSNLTVSGKSLQNELDKLNEKISNLEERLAALEK